MSVFLALLLSGGLYVGVYRLFGWFRKMSAEHRRRLIEAGYQENNPGRRLRGDRYVRIGVIAFMVIDGILFLTANNFIGDQMPAVPAFAASWVLAVILSIVPAALVYSVVLLHGEWSHPRGDIALLLRDHQFHPAALPVVPKGEYGSSSIIDAIKAGLSNPSGITIGRRRIVEQEVAK